MKRVWGDLYPETGPEVVSLMYDADREILAEYIYEVIKHGDDEHQRWLKDKVNEIFRVV